MTETTRHRAYTIAFNLEFRDSLGPARAAYEAVSDLMESDSEPFRQAVLQAVVGAVLRKTLDSAVNFAEFSMKKTAEVE